MASSSTETKIIYHLDDQDTPYLVKLPIAADRCTLLHLKNALAKPNYKYFFKSMDDDFGFVLGPTYNITIKLANIYDYKEIILRVFDLLIRFIKLIDNSH